MTIMKTKTKSVFGLPENEKLAYIREYLLNELETLEDDQLADFTVVTRFDGLAYGFHTYNVIDEDNMGDVPLWIHQLTEMANDDDEGVYATEKVAQEFEKYRLALRACLGDVLTTEIAERMIDADEGEYLVLMTLMGHGVGIWAGRWDHYEKEGIDLKTVEETLKRKLSVFADGCGSGSIEEAMYDAKYDIGAYRRTALTEYINSAKIRDLRSDDEIIEEDQEFFACENRTVLNDTFANWFDGAGISDDERDALIEIAHKKYTAMVDDLKHMHSVRVTWLESYADWNPRKYDVVSNDGYGLIAARDHEHTSNYSQVRESLNLFWKSLEQNLEQ